MFAKFLTAGIGMVLFAAALPAEPVAENRAATYQVHHALLVKEIPQSAQSVRVWFWLPDDDDCQKVLDLSVLEAPGDYRITRDAVHGHSYLYAELNKPTSSTERLATDFVIRRQAVSFQLDPTKAGSLNEAHRKAFCGVPAP
jgi:hypothetical protein